MTVPDYPPGEWSALLVGPQWVSITLPEFITRRIIAIATTPAASLMVNTFALKDNPSILQESVRQIRHELTRRLDRARPARKGDYRNCWSAVTFSNMSTLPPAPPAPGPPPWPQVAPSRPQRWPMFASLVIALVAIGLAIGCWFRPLPSNKASLRRPRPATQTNRPPTPKQPCAPPSGKWTMHWLWSDARNGGSTTQPRNSPRLRARGKYSMPAAGIS